MCKWFRKWHFSTGSIESSASDYHCCCLRTPWGDLDIAFTSVTKNVTPESQAAQLERWVERVIADHKAAVDKDKN